MQVNKIKVRALMMTNQELAKKILELIGGKENVITAANCMTRLRVKLKDDSRADLSLLKETEGVLGIVEDDTLQIVLGPGKAKKVTDLFIETAGLTEAKADVEPTDDWQANKAAIKGGQKNSKFKDALRVIADIFIPMIPAIIAAGLFNGIASLLSQTSFGKVAVAGGVESGGLVFVFITLLQLIGGAFLSYFAIYTGINAAKKFGATPALGGMIGGMSIMPQIVTISTTFGLYNEEVPLESILTTGKGGIIGVVIGVWILSVIEKRVRKIVPDVLDLVVTPFITLLISAVLFVFIIMPAAGYASDALVKGLSVIINSPNPVVSVISGYVLAAVFLPMVLLGLHHGLIPIYSIQLETFTAANGFPGGVTLFPVLAMAGAGQVGAALAIYLKARRVNNTRMKKIIIGALPAGFLGVGEPLIYGVTLPIGKSFITAGLGAGFGGAFVRFMGVSATAWGPSGLVAIPMMQTAGMMLSFFIGLVIAYVAGFIITSIFIKDEDVASV